MAAKVHIYTYTGMKGFRQFSGTEHQIAGSDCPFSQPQRSAYFRTPTRVTCDWNLVTCQHCRRFGRRVGYIDT